LSFGAPLWPASSDRPIDVVGLGENSVDRVCEVASLPESGAKSPLLSYRERPGGQVATAMLACARLGLRSAYLGLVGDDADADRALAPLDAAGVDLGGVHRVRGAHTRVAVILVERANAERSVLWLRDPALVFRSADLDRRSIAAARVLEVDLSDPDAALWAAREARSSGTAVVLDAEVSSAEVSRILPLVDFPIVSQGFAETWEGRGAPEETLRELAGHGARLAVVTAGALGAWGWLDGRAISSPAHPVEVADTTGAGDAFRGGFIWSLVRGHDAASSLRAANAAAAMNCRAMGAQGGLPTEVELEAFLAR
jgi:sugar/nucleoside kinase (ribokinase family)